MPSSRAEVWQRRCSTDADPQQFQTAERVTLKKGHVDFFPPPVFRLLVGTFCLK